MYYDFSLGLVGVSNQTNNENKLLQMYSDIVNKMNIYTGKRELQRIQFNMNFTFETGYFGTVTVRNNNATHIVNQYYPALNTSSIIQMHVNFNDNNDTMSIHISKNGKKN